ncbi:unnamed protein product, partial [Prorocentrum cordatum]
PFRARAARRKAESRTSPLAAPSLPAMGSSALVLALGLLPALASGHAFLTKPEMRGGAYNNVGNGYCPQCLGSTDLPMATCGNAHFLDAVGPVTELRAGQLAEFVITVTAHHKGHFVFRLCDQRLDSQTGDYQAQEECLNEHVLSRARPEEVHADCQPNDPRGDCQPYDEANPGHWYLPPHNGSHLTRTQHRFHYRIPADLTCESCTLQWWWMSANSCTPHPDAYRCYFQEMERQGWDASAWCDGVVCSYQGECPAEQGGPVLCGEQFKNCADVRLVEGGGASAGPTPAPSPTEPTSPTEPPETPEPEPEPEPEGSKQLVAFVENWLPCPSLDKIRGYDKVIVSFAVSYTWSPTKNQCDQSCTIGVPATCDNQAKPDLIETWRQAGTKVLLSFGGAGMGGSWAGDVNDCWEYCFGRVDSVVSRLVEIIDSQGFDGVDMWLPAYDHTDTSSQFLKDLTTGLRAALPPGKIISHAPMDGDIAAGAPYFRVLQEVASSVDYLLPQYYNGPLRPAIDTQPAIEHMGHLVDDIFGGDASKVVFGFCIADCSGTGSNVDGSQAAAILQDVRRRRRRPRRRPRPRRPRRRCRRRRRRPRRRPRPPPPRPAGSPASAKRLWPTTARPGTSLGPVPRAWLGTTSATTTLSMILRASARSGPRTCGAEKRRSWSLAAAGAGRTPSWARLCSRPCALCRALLPARCSGPEPGLFCPMGVPKSPSPRRRSIVAAHQCRQDVAAHPSSPSACSVLAALEAGSGNSAQASCQEKGRKVGR